MTSVGLENIRKTFGSAVAVDGISLEIAAGELFFLLGPSGCGKTTLLRIIAGLIEPTGGRVLFNGEDVTRLATQERNAVMCFQSYALWPHMTVRQNIRFGLETKGTLRGERAQRVDEAIRRVRLEAHADKKPNELSGGQQQRVALARALVVRPRCLLLDEPLSNLDAKLRLEMRTEIRDICRQFGLTSVYVTHDQKEALSIADRMAILDRGRIVQAGTPRDLYLRPASRFAAEFMGETNLLRAQKLAAADGNVRVKTEIGEFICRGPASAAAGGLLSIRPEALRLSPAPSDAPNQFAGAITHTTYLGEIAQHRIQAGGLTLKAYELNPRRIVAEGGAEPVTAWFMPEDGALLGE